MLKYYENLLTDEECEEIKNEILFLHEKNKCKHEIDSIDLKNSYGFFNQPSCIKYVSKIERRLINDYGKNISFVNNYSRIYFNDSRMHCHVDRDNLDITLSLNIFSNLQQSFPLYISNIEMTQDHVQDFHNPEIAKLYQNDYTSWETPKGCGVSCLAKKFPHWRDPLFCKEDQMFIQAFFHWEII